MRPLFVIILACTVFGGMHLLMSFHALDRGPALLDAPLHPSTGEFRLEIALTFEAGPDAFSADAAGDAPSVVVRRAGTEIYRATGEVGCDVPLEIRPVLGILQGRNSFYVEASPRDRTPAYRALGIRLFRDDVLLGERVILVEPGAAVQGVLDVDVTESGS